MTTTGCLYGVHYHITYHLLDSRNLNARNVKKSFIYNVMSMKLFMVDFSDFGVCRVCSNEGVHLYRHARSFA